MVLQWFCAALILGYEIARLSERLQEVVVHGQEIVLHIALFGS